MKFKDVTGKRFGRLLVLKRVSSPRQENRQRIFWLCQCACGNTVTIETYSLRNQSRSCGCGRGISHLIHGQGKHPKDGKRDQAYAMFNNAKQRAKKKGLVFNLKLKDVVVPKICPVLGIPLFRGKNGMANNSPTLDRIKLTRGYVRGNVAVISFRANRIKSDAKTWEVEKVLAYMRKHG
jgi:hypothetical protein